MMHAAGLAGLGWLALTPLVPKAPEWIFWGAVAIGGVASLIWMYREAVGMSDAGRRLAYGAHGLGLAFVTNLILLLWVATLQPPVQSLLYGGPETMFAQAAFVAAVGILVLLFGLMAAFPWKTTAPIVVAAVGMLLWSVGDRALVAVALRTANLGGGVPIVYRPAGLRETEASRRACLVLSAGDMRIVWFPGHAGETSARQSALENCDPAAFRRRLKDGSKAWDEGRFMKDDDVRALRAADLYGSS